MIDLRVPAGTLASLKIAVESGADSVYTGFRTATNARNFPGLNLNYEEMKEGINYAHERGKKVYVTVNVYPQSNLENSFKAVDMAREAGADGVIVSDFAVLNYVKKHHPDFRIHLSVLASVCNIEAVRFYQEEFGIKCVVLPRVMNIEEIAELCRNTDIEVEVFAFGVL